MAAVKGKDTSPEIEVRRALFSEGYRYRKNYRIGRKTIDIAFPKKRVAVLIDGCFWHGCPSCYKAPKSNKKYWKSKIETNILRDERTDKELELAGWRSIRLWEHELKEDESSALRRISGLLAESTT